MGVSQNLITDLSKDKYTIKANSVQTISFMGADPNYYRITNGGKKDLYLGVSMMPTEDFFDQRIPAGVTSLYVDAYGHESIYIYNPSEFDANIVITSFTANFDPSVLALSGMGQDLSSIELSGKFDATGDLETNIAEIKNNAATLKTLHDYLKWKKSCTIIKSGTNIETDDTTTLNYINMLSNDSDNDMEITLKQSTFILKPHEVLTDLFFHSKITLIISSGSSFRLIGGV